jgi:hypothetical protein
MLVPLKLCEEIENVKAAFPSQICRKNSSFAAN